MMARQDAAGVAAGKRSGVATASRQRVVRLALELHLALACAEAAPTHPMRARHRADVAFLTEPAGRARRAHVAPDPRAAAHGARFLLKAPPAPIRAAHVRGPTEAAWAAYGEER